VDLRVFSVTLTGGTVTPLPAPLTRVALGEGASSASAARGGGCKDTWLLA
jgi:uncharacterized circularly permuted ATP-grasp superfamily protein